jgi:hypothetical protein
MSAMYVGIILGLQAKAIWSWRGVWRWLAIAPFAVLAGYILLAMILVMLDPTFLTNWMAILKVLFLAGGAFICFLWLARGLVRLTTEF